ncbi:ferredoxin (iron-sulfur cluster-binding protein) [Thermodesulfatator indicus DSM 15286]|uniref:Ferredoxin (Iron-sulfur cluster-binding protein) n=1 Tax=Thermodesulfatator indicus (strain DSM 15286 / JCM 11887 / CIR29812) TaxID=667014 RepID=F8AAR8_THEID|nr:ATP-binding protein [Thermodesulfatator indicus]AEH44351.1 ferredoxin (iron-sulfur cluster-binding protein) [Thermodesulfatator indicus DSM 15286]
MKEILVLSGKGGTGKTTVCAALAVLLKGEKVLADADVDAANLALFLKAQTLEKEPFKSGWEPVKNEDLCTSCGICLEKCRFEAVREDFSIDSFLCEGCGVCAWFCPEKAISMEEKEVGELMYSETKYGPLVHAELYPGEENSGKLVIGVKRKAQEIAKQENADLILIDGSPGVGCPVIASLSGVDAVLMVAEPTIAGLHDLKRLKGLLDHFSIPGYLIVNKADLNPDMTQKLLCEETGFKPLGSIPYDPDVYGAIHAATPLPEYSEGQATQALKKITTKIENIIL